MMRRLHIVPVILMLAVIVALRVQAQEHAHTVAMPETLTWVEPATLPGARLAVVQGDPGKEGLFVYRLKMPAGYRIPPHLDPHFAWVGGTETVVQVHGVGPTDLRFVNPEDDPRKKS
jgi:hypothetical protein